LERIWADDALPEESTSLLFNLTAARALLLLLLMLLLCCQQGLWRIRDFAVGNMNLVPEFMCVIDGVVGQIGDIAVMHKGDIIVSFFLIKPSWYCVCWHAHSVRTDAYTPSARSVALVWCFILRTSCQLAAQHDMPRMHSSFPKAICIALLVLFPYSGP
jgi:hypothetical protein